MSDVITIIPNWNGKEYLNECITSLKAQTHSTDIVMVDNGSADGSVKFVRKNFPDVTIIEHEKNLGFTGGVNAGITYGLNNDYDYMALFNNDAVADKDWLKELVEALEEKPGAGIVTCKFLEMGTGNIDSTGDFYSVWGTPFPRGRDEKDAGQYEELEEVFAASGGASLYRAELFKDVGQFDQRFFAYYEDVDISFRARLLGWKVYYTPQAIAHHHIGGTAGTLKNFSHYHQLKNYFYLYFKNMPGWMFWKYLPRILMVLGYKTLSHLLHGNITVVAKAYFAIIKNTPGVMRDRFRIQRNRKVSTREIDDLLLKEFSPTQKDKPIYRLLSSIFTIRSKKH